MDDRKVILIRRNWRAELNLCILFAIFCPLSLYLTYRFPQTVITGKLFSIGQKNINLTLPLLWFIPGGILGTFFWKIFDAEYALDPNGIETKTGILGVTQTTRRIRYEDIRSVEVSQSLLHRILNIGRIEIGTAATSDVEIIIDGVLGPYEIQTLLQNERDKRQNLNSDD